MVEENNAGCELNSDTTVSLNLSGATIAFSEEETDNNSISSENHSHHGDSDDEKNNCNNFQLSNCVLPPNTSLNVENSSDVIVGPVTQFHGPVTIYQNTHNNGFIPNDTRKYLTNGTDSFTSTANTSAKLVSSETLSGKTPVRSLTRKKIIAIAVLIFLIIVLSTVIISYSVSIYISNENNKDSYINDLNDVSDIVSTSDKPQIANSSHKLIYRDRWGGRPPLYERPVKHPIKYVIISHTAGISCYSIPECSRIMVQIQSLHVSQNSPDIGYNFLIGGDQNIYVARGWDCHNFHMNLDTIGICFIGNYIYNVLTPGMIEAAMQLIKMGVDSGKLAKDYIIVAHNQTYNTQSPGPNIYNQMKYWPHFSPDSLDDIPDIPTK